MNAQKVGHMWRVIFSIECLFKCSLRHTQKKRKLMIQILCCSAVYFEKKPQIIAQSSWDHSSALRCWPLLIVIAQKMPNIIRKKKMWWQIKIDPPRRRRCHAVGKGSESPSKDIPLLEKNRETRPHNSWEISALYIWAIFKAMSFGNFHPIYIILLSMQHF